MIALFTKLEFELEKLVTALKSQGLFTSHSAQVMAIQQAIAAIKTALYAIEETPVKPAPEND